MRSLKISIVTPSYNQGKFIEEAIKSVIDQNYDNYEHIIIDNCSDDETKEIVQKYPNIVFVSEPDEGQSDALNKGFRRATGDIIGWLNADDYYLEGTFEKALGILKAPDIDGLYSNVRFVNEKKELVKNLIIHKPVKWLSLFHCYIPSTSFFFKREVIERGLSIDKEMHISMDKDFFVNIMHHGFKIQFVNEFFAAFRWHDSNKSLDTPEIVKMRSREGLIIFNRYTRFNFRLTKENIARYRFVAQMLLFYRKFLKVFNPKYSYHRLVKTSRT
jgi:glycosyltransferase involved in cell wall biosynthesis